MRAYLRRKFNRLFREIRAKYRNVKKSWKLFGIKAFYIKKDYTFWKEQNIYEIDNSIINNDAWEITLSKLSKLNKSVNYWVLRNAYWHSFVKLHFLPKTKSYKKTRTHIDALNEHLESVKFLYEQEKKRQENTDSKAKQVISNAGIILTLFGALSALLLNQSIVNYVSKPFSIYCSVVILILLLISLSLAIYVLDFKKYNRPNVDVLGVERFNKETFLRERVMSYLLPLEINTYTNTVKSKRIKLATVLFWLALFGVTVVFCYNFCNWNFKTGIEPPQKIEIIKGKLDINSNCCDTIVKSDFSVLDNYIYFKFNEHSILPEVTNELNYIIQYLNKKANVKIQLTGYTDYIGGENYNLKLSKLRVEAVRTYLISNKIDDRRIIVAYKGEKEPIDKQQTKVSAGINRRVEYVFK